MKHVILAIALAALALCAAGSAMAQQGLSPSDSLLFNLLPQSYDRPVDPNLFVIRPGEEITIIFLRSSLEPLSMRVSADGQLIHTSFGAIDVNGMTLAELRKRLAEPLRAQYNVKDLVISVGAPRLVGITVTGAVARPGFYRAYSSQRTSEIIAMAGGVLSTGSTRRITLYNGARALPVDLDRALYLGDESANLCLYAGYRVEVPPRSAEVVQVVGEVVNPRSIELRPNDSLLTLVALAGGPTLQGDLPKIRLVGNHSRDITQPGTAIMAGDIIEIPHAGSTAEGVSAFGELKSPGTFFYQQGMTVDQVVKLADGPTDQANLSRVTIFRLAETDNGDPHSYLRYPIEVTQAAFAAITLVPMDSIVVPRRLGWVRVSGLVRAPGLLPYTDGKDAQSYIATAGGFLREASTDLVGLFNRVSRITSTVAPSTKVQDGDEIIVMAGEPAP